MPAFITQPARSVYRVVKDDSYREIFDAITAELMKQDNWLCRKKQFIISLQSLEYIISKETDNGEPDGDPWRAFVRVVPYFVAGILEKLAETEIATVEQMAFYALSVHLEHQDAADRWANESPKHWKAFKKFARSNRYYFKILGTGASMVERGGESV